MAAIINNFRIQEPLCALHTEVCQHAFVDNYKMKLICYRCIPLYPSYPSESSPKIIPIDQLRDYIASSLAHEQSRLTKSPPLDIHSLIDTKKKQISQKHYRIVQQLMKRLTKDRETLYSELDTLQKYYQGQQARYQYNVEQREQIVRYLKEFCIDDELMRLKIMVSNQFGLGSFLAQLRALQGLGDELGGRNGALLMADVQREIKNREESSFMFQLQNFLRSQPEQTLITPLKLGPQKQKSPTPTLSTQRRNQSQQNLLLKSPRTSRQHSFAQLPRLAMN